MAQNNWFLVDKNGLAKLVEKWGRGRVIAELIQNAWDEEGVTDVSVSMEPIPNAPYATLVVSDNSDKGFHNLSHAYTMFAESKKANDPTKRGRFNLGEKLFIALCKECKIVTVPGTVIFKEDGTRIHKKSGQARGSTVTATVRATREQIAEALAYLHTLIPPASISTTINGTLLASRLPLKSFTATLPTVVSDEEGNIKAARRQTTVDCYAPVDGEVPTLYEMGLPVVELGDDVKWHVNVCQKVPLTQDRRNVSSPAYRQELLVAVANNMAHLMTAEDHVKPVWVDVVADKRTDSSVFAASFKARFGDKTVAFDPSDPESNSTAVAHGYKRVHGSQLSKEEWSRVRELELAPAAGKKFPTNPTNGTAPNLERKDWTEAMKFIEKECIWVAEKLLGVSISVNISYMTVGLACYGNNRLTFSVKLLGRRWFDRMMQDIKQNTISEEFHALLIHEFAHHYEPDHKTANFYDTCCRLGAKLAAVMAKD